MKRTIGLHEILPGQRATVETLNHEGAMRRRLRDIGMIEETVIECVGRSPGGDPCAYLVRGSVIALRAEDAKYIRVWLTDGERD